MRILNFEIFYFHSEQVFARSEEHSSEKKIPFFPFFHPLDSMALNLSVSITDRLIGRISVGMFITTIMPYRSPLENV